MRSREIFYRITGSHRGWTEWYQSADMPMLYAADPSASPATQERERLAAWEMYLRAFYLTTGERGHMTRESFYNATGVPPSAIEWDEWREIRRGTP